MLSRTPPEAHRLVRLVFRAYGRLEATVYGLVGESGCGKTTILRCLCGLNRQWSGSIRIAGKLAIEIEGGNHLEEARAAGRGAVLASAHYGNWEAVRLAAQRLGCETGFIYRPQNNRYLDRLAFRLPSCAGGPVLQKGRQGMRQMMIEEVQPGLGKSVAALE